MPGQPLRPKSQTPAKAVPAESLPAGTGFSQEKSKFSGIAVAGAATESSRSHSEDAQQRTTWLRYGCERRRAAGCGEAEILFPLVVLIGGTGRPQEQLGRGGRIAGFQPTIATRR
jgi:hypothetical protein